MLEVLVERFNYIPIIILMMTGLYVIIATGNLVKRLVGGFHQKLRANQLREVGA